MQKVGAVMPDRPTSVVRDLLTKREVARLVGLSVRTIERYVAQGLFPQPLRLTRRCVRWRRRDIEAYLERLYRSTGGPRPARGAAS